MKSILQLFLILIVTGQIIAQNQYDSQGKRHGIWQKKYRNGNLRYIGKFEHGQETGVFKYYAITGEKHPIVIKEFGKSNHLVTVSFYTTKGVLESKGLMKDQKRTGLWTYYFKDGKTPMLYENYKEGVLEGEVKTFYKNGKLAETAHYKNGKLHGKRIRYNENGEQVELISYKDGVMHGPAVFYDEKGEIFARGSYENGIKTGIWEFNMDGEMIKSAPDKIKINK